MQSCQSRSFAIGPAKKAQDAKKGKGSTEGGRDPRDALLEACLTGEFHPQAFDYLEDETLAADAAKAKEYSKLMMSVHRQRQALESKKLKYKKAAIAAIPKGKLRDAAMAPDYTPFPEKLYAPSLTPPVASLSEELAARSKPVKKLR